MEDAIMMVNAYSQQQDDQWRQTREVAYMIYCTATESNGRETIYEFMPLPGDPTKAELAAAKKARYRRKVESHKATVDRLIAKGVIKKPVPKKKVDKP